MKYDRVYWFVSEGDCIDPVRYIIVQYRAKSLLQLCLSSPMTVLYGLSFRALPLDLRQQTYLNLDLPSLVNLRTCRVSKYTHIYIVKAMFV